MKSKQNKKYFLSQDNDCHWYLVENEHRKKWYDWLDTDSQTMPEYAEELGGRPSSVVFENPDFI